MSTQATPAARGAQRAARLVLALGLLAAGCAPPAMLRPLASLPEGRNAEVGGAFAAVSPRPYATEAWHYVGQAWGSFRLTRALDLSAITAFDSSGFALGGALRLEAFHSSHLSLGPEVEGGWLWGAFAVHASLRLVDELRVYTAPRIGNWGGAWTPGVPVGLSVPLYGGFQLRGEGQLSWADFKYYNRRFIGAGALVYQW